MHSLKCILLILLTNISNIAYSQVIRADFETDPILKGRTDSDDAAFYFNKHEPSKTSV